MSRLPLPSRCTLLVELVIVSISPVPKLEPAPVSYIHWESMPDPAPPLKSSLKTVDQPDGGPGTAADAMAAGTARAATTMAGAIEGERQPASWAPPGGAFTDTHDALRYAGHTRPPYPAPRA